MVSVQMTADTRPNELTPFYLTLICFIGEMDCSCLVGQKPFHTCLVAGSCPLWGDCRPISSLRRSTTRFCSPQSDAMPEQASLLMIEFLSWVSSRPRTYAESMEAWRSSCPRHAVWDDALVDGLIEIVSAESLPLSKVTLTAQGRALLNWNRSNEHNEANHGL